MGTVAPCVPPAIRLPSATVICSGRAASVNSLFSKNELAASATVFQQFSSVAEAEKEICRLENMIHWMPEMIWYFGQLEEKLLNPVQLYIPDTQRQFWICTDASDFAVGGVLEQRRCKYPEPDDPTQGCGCPLFPVAFLFRELQGDKSHGQRAWPVRDKETYAIVATLHKFHAWLQQSRLFLKRGGSQRITAAWSI